MRNPIGAVSCHLPFTTVEQAFDIAALHGLDQIEWFESGAPRFSTPSVAARIRELSATTGIGIGFHAPYIGAWSLAQTDPALGDRAATDMVERAVRIGARMATLHLGTTPAGMSRDQAMTAACRALETAVRVAAANNVRLAVENFTRCHNPGDLGDTVDELGRALEVIPPEIGGWTLDTGHAAITGNLAELFDAFGDRLLNTHLHDSDGKTDGHLPPAQGILDWNALLTELSTLGYTGPLTLEFPERSGRYPQFINRIRNSDSP